MATYPASVLTKEHMQVFGVIIQAFAKAEHLMQGAMAGIIKTHPAPIAVITNGLQYQARREALLALIKATDMVPQHAEKTAWFLGNINRHNTLRNWIAHCYWVPGTRENTIKPAQLKTRGGLSILGVDEAEEDYTIKELAECAQDVLTQCDLFAEFIAATWPECVALYELPE